MHKNTFASLILAAAVLGCASPASIEVTPEPLVLEGKGATGKLIATVLDEDGKVLEGDHPVTWMCLESKVANLRQDGTVEARSSGSALYDVEVVGTNVNYQGHIIVKIAETIRVAQSEVLLAVGQPADGLWAEVRGDNDHRLEGYVPSWKVEDGSVVRIEQTSPPDAERAVIRLTGLKPGETFVTASYGEIAEDVRVVVIDPSAVPAAGEGEAPADPAGG